MLCVLISIYSEQYVLYHVRKFIILKSVCDSYISCFIIGSSRYLVHDYIVWLYMLVLYLSDSRNYMWFVYCIHPIKSMLHYISYKVSDWPVEMLKFISWFQKQNLNIKFDTFFISNTIKIFFVIQILISSCNNVVIKKKIQNAVKHF